MTPSCNYPIADLFKCQEESIRTRFRVTSLQKSVLAREYLLQKFIQNRVVRLKFSPGIDVVVDAIRWVALGVTVEETLRSLGEILPVSGHSVRLLP